MSKALRGLIALLALVVLVLGFAPPASAADYTYQVLSNNTTQTIGSGCHTTGVYPGVYGSSAARPAFRSMMSVNQYAVFCIYVGMENRTYNGVYSTDEPEVKLRWYCAAPDGSEEQCVSFHTDVTMKVSDLMVFHINIACNEDPASSAPLCSNTVHNDTYWMWPSNWSPFTVYHPSYNQVLSTSFHGWTSNEYVNGYPVGSAATPTYYVTDNY